LRIYRTALSDELYLNNGNWLGGSVVSKTGDKLILDTSFAGKIEIQWADVSHIKTDKPVRVTLEDGSAVTGTLSLTDGEEQRIAVEADTVSRPLAVQHIAAINSPEVPRLKCTGRRPACESLSMTTCRLACSTISIGTLHLWTMRSKTTTSIC
jgi:hypothetical protein